MTPDDPRHGSRNGYRLGCRDTCCRTAEADGARRRRAQKYLRRTDTLLADATGTHRRIQALVALGWSLSEVSRRAGYSRHHADLILDRTTLQLDTAARFAALYDRLCMTLPPIQTKAQKVAATKARNHATRNGWVPPLAWDDIDNDAAPAYEDPRLAKRRQLDTVLVDRVVAGEHDLIAAATVAEREAIVARFRAAGMPLRSLEVVGIKPDRYTEEDAA